MKESNLYPLVEKWVKNQFSCFKTAINKGLIYSRMDVIGVRDVGGELSGDIEIITVEVKRGTEPFATASGQASGYKVYANRVYLADLRNDNFSRDEIDIAVHLGIGLIQIKNNKCTEIITSPYHEPLKRLNLALLEKLSLCQCRFCGSFFESTKFSQNNKVQSKLSRENIDIALKNEKGIIFWNRELDERKRKIGVQNKKDELTYERRYICPDCVQIFFN